MFDSEWISLRNAVVRTNDPAHIKSDRAMNCTDNWPSINHADYQLKEFIEAIVDGRILSRGVFALASYRADVMCFDSPKSGDNSKNLFDDEHQTNTVKLVQLLCDVKIKAAYGRRREFCPIVKMHGGEEFSRSELFITDDANGDNFEFGLRCEKTYTNIPSQFWESKLHHFEDNTLLSHSRDGRQSSSADKLKTKLDHVSELREHYGNFAVYKNVEIEVASFQQWLGDIDNHLKTDSNVAVRKGPGRPRHDQQYKYVDEFSYEFIKMNKSSTQKAFYGEVKKHIEEKQKQDSRPDEIILSESSVRDYIKKQKYWPELRAYYGTPAI